MCKHNSSLFRGFLKKTLAALLTLQVAGIFPGLAEPIGEGAQGQGMIIERRFVDKEGTHELTVRMPGADALPVLKAAFLVGDHRFKYQILHFGLVRIDEKNGLTRILPFLESVFSQQEPMTKGDILFHVFPLAPEHPATRNMLNACLAETGDGKEIVALRQVAADFLKYLETRDPSLLEEYDLSAEPIRLQDE